MRALTCATLAAIGAFGGAAAFSPPNAGGPAPADARPVPAAGGRQGTRTPTRVAAPEGRVLQPPEHLREDQAWSLQPTGAGGAAASRADEHAEPAASR